MEVLTLNGQKYVKASKAARDLGYTSDYVGQLCRSGAVDAHLVGRTWYVNPDTLGAHRVEKKRNARVKAREHAKRSIEQARSLKVEESTKTYKNIAIHYEGDKSGLIPEVRRVAIESELHHIEPVEDSGEKYSIENKDKKVILSGSIPVQDAENEEQYTDTVTLTPKINRKSPHSEVSPVRKKLAVAEEERTETISPEKKETFSERIMALDTDPEISSEIPLENGGFSIKSVLIYSLSFLIIVLSIGSIFVAERSTFFGGVVTSSFDIEMSAVSDFIK